MTILAIDPSTTSLGYAVYQDGLAMEDGVVLFGMVNPIDYLQELVEFLDSVAERHEITHVATEATFINAFQGNSSALLNVSSSQIQMWCELRGLPCHRYSNSTVKKAVTGSGKAKKQAVYAAMVGYMTEASRALPHPPKSQVGAGYDVADAHAIAHTAMMRHMSGDVKKKSRKPKAA